MDGLNIALEEILEFNGLMINSFEWIADYGGDYGYGDYGSGGYDG